MKINQTSRTFPRSTSECFKDADYACAIEALASAIGPYILGVAIAVVSCIVFYFSV